jgi:long-chain acyl-CoA synthetase
MKAVVSDLTSIAASRHGSALALIVPEGGSFTFEQVDVLAVRFAGGLAARGIGQGDRIVLNLPNGWHWIVAFHALARLGAVVVPANILLTQREIDFLAQDSGARARIALNSEDAQFGPVLTLTGTQGCIAFDKLLDASPASAAAVAPEDLLAISYTSGTTGKPKGVMLTHGNVAASVMHTATMHVRHAGDRIYSALPFPHVYGNIVMNACFLTGAALIAPQRFEAGTALAAIAEHRITLFEGVPTMFYQMLAHPTVETTDLSSLTRCTVGGQTMPTAKLDLVATRFGCPVLELWGMTEVGGPATSHSPYWPARHGSVGLPFPGTEIKLVDIKDAAQEAAPGTPGELAVRGAQVTKGYWNQAEATSAAIDRAGWLMTGDIARQDDDGYLFIVDRRKDMILTAGYNIYPAELEQVFAMHADVAMIAVAGFPDEEKGEVAHAFVVVRPGASITAEGLIQHCRRYLASYKVPRQIHFVDDLPRTSSGKILRRALAIPQGSAVPFQGLHR